MNDNIENVAQFILANEDAKRMREYLSRGRRFKVFSDGDLKATYVKAMADWAATQPPWGPLDTLHDVMAEAEIRSLALPESEVAGYSATIRRLVFDRMIQNSTADGSSVIEDGIRAYQASRRSMK